VAYGPSALRRSTLDCGDAKLAQNYVMCWRGAKPNAAPACLMHVQVSVCSSLLYRMPNHSVCKRIVRHSSFVCESSCSQRHDGMEAAGLSRFEQLVYSRAAASCLCHSLASDNARIRIVHWSAAACLTSRRYQYQLRPHPDPMLFLARSNGKRSRYFARPTFRDVYV